MTRIAGTLPGDLCTFMIISRWILRRMRNVAYRIIEKIKTHILCSISFFRKPCRLWDNVEKCGRPKRATDDNMAHARCMLDKAMYTNSDYLLLTVFCTAKNGYAIVPQCYVIRILLIFINCSCPNPCYSCILLFMVFVVYVMTGTLMLWFVTSSEKNIFCAGIQWPS